MSIAFLFPGQASQYVLMGKDLFDAFEIARETYRQADEILDFDLKRVSFEGPEEELKQTVITQPAIFVHSIIMNKLLQERNIEPQYVAGHSLGEYSALVAAKAFSFEKGLELVKLRGALMQQAGILKPGTMAAIIGLSGAEVEEICQKASAEGVIVPANYNSPQQIAVSGSIDGVKKAMELAKQAGAKRAMELEVSGAFHSPLMEAAIGEMTEALKNVDIQKPECPIVPNVTAKPTQDPEEIRTCLIEQLTHPVRWVDSIEALTAQNVERFYEVGPGKVLTGLIRRIDRLVPCLQIDKKEDLESLS